MMHTLQLPCVLDKDSAWNCQKISLDNNEQKIITVNNDPKVHQKIKTYVPYYFENGVNTNHHHHPHSQLHHNHPGYYSHPFIRRFLLIKINALLHKECQINHHFIKELVNIFNFYSSSSMPKIIKSSSDEQIMAQFILHFKILQNYISLTEIEDVLQGKVYLTTVLLYTYHEGIEFVQKIIHSFTLIHRALDGKASPFFHKVHHSKNHHGQIEFARRVSELASLTPELAVSQVGLGQDPYSLRCAPQICGVAIDCLQLLKNHLPNALNNFHFKNIHIQDQVIENISIWGDTEQLLNDIALTALHQIGSVMFVRTQRLLNQHLAKTNLHDSSNPYKHFDVLKRALERNIHCLTNNRLLCSPSTADTMNINNYESDVFKNDGKAYEKHINILDNLHHILTLEVMSSIAAIKHKNGIESGHVYQNQKMNKCFHHLSDHLSQDNFLHSVDFISNEWHP